MNNRIIPASKLNNKNAKQHAQILQDRLTEAINQCNDLTDESVIKAAAEYNDFTSQYID